MKKLVKKSINEFAKNKNVLTKNETKKLKGGITTTDIMGV